MADSSDLNFGIRESSRRQFPEWKEVVVGRYFGNADKQYEMMRRAGLSPLIRFKDILQEARVHAEVAPSQARLQLVKVQLHEIGLVYPCSIYEVQPTLMEHDLMAYVHEFFSWLVMGHPDALSEGDDFYGFSQPAEIHGGDFIPRTRMTNGKKFLLAADVLRKEFKPEDTFIAVQWVMDV